VFVGHFREENRRLVARLGLHDAVLERGYLPHSDCIRELTAADVLWMVVGDDVGSPGKTYEYIGARKPILACAPEGFLKTTVLAAGGMVVSPKDVPAIKKAILELYARWERHMLTGPPEDVVKGYSRVFLTGELVKLFELLVDRS
jgi:glycosyltransferase involved in cell wall biosynthesis